MMNERGVLGRENYIEKIETIARYFSDVKKWDTNAISLFENSESNSFFNQAVIKDLHPFDTTQNVGEMLHFLDEQNKNYTLWCWENDASEILLEHLRLYKFEQQDIFSTLIAEVQHINFDFYLLEGFDFKMVSSAKELTEFSKVHCTLEPNLKRRKSLQRFYTKLASLENYKIPHFELFYGSYEGEIVAVSNLFFNQDAVGIYDLMVKEEFMNTAVATVMYKHLLLEARKSGIPNCIVQIPLEQKMKFLKYGFNETSRAMRFS